MSRPLLHVSSREHAPAQATIAGGGVIPHIHKSLINKTTKLEKVCPPRQACACSTPARQPD